MVDDTYLKRIQAYISKEKQLLIERFHDAKTLKLFPSMTSFVLMKIKERFDAAYLCSKMANHRVLLRNGSSFIGLSDRFVRINLKSSEINAMVADKIREIIT